MRRFILSSALLLASASAHAQSVDIGSVMSANGISAPSGTDPSQLGSMPMGGAGPQTGAGSQVPKGRSAKQAKQTKQSGTATRESASETKARGIAAKYGVSW